VFLGCSSSGVSGLQLIHTPIHGYPDPYLVESNSMEKKW